MADIYNRYTISTLTIYLIKYLNLPNQIEEESSGEARNFYDVAVAAMRAGNTFVAQESMARALSATQMSGGRGKRETDDGEIIQKSSFLCDEKDVSLLITLSII